MPSYKYVAIDTGGAKVKGVIDASSAVRVRNELLTKQFEVVEIKERKSFSQIEITTKKIKPEELMNFSRHLAAFLRAGIPILDALEALTDEKNSPVLSGLLIDVQDALRSGSTFSEAIGAHEELFPKYYVGIVRSAELTGNLDVVLEQLSVYIERDLEAKRAIKSALTYPIVVALLAVVTVFILVLYVLPKFEDFFKGFNAKLPLPTRMLLGMSRFVGHWWWLMFAVGIIAALVWYLYGRTEDGKMTKARLMLRLPVFGDIVRYAVVERFCRILGAMLRAGVPIPEAMSAATEGTNNVVFQDALVGARDEMLRGSGLAAPIAATGLFPGSAAQMLRVGEDSGTLDKQLEVAADFYQSELQHKLKRLTTLFEPAVIVVMGGIVAFVAIALVSAMYGIFNQVHVK